MVKQRKESAPPTQFQGASASARPSINYIAQSDEIYLNVTETGNYIVIPPDGGWGWVVVVAAFLTFMFTDGFAYCFGLFMQDIANEYLVSVTVVSITSSLITAEIYVMGPVFCALINRYGFRIIAVIGGLGAAACVMSASFAPNYTIFLVILGVIGGVFMSMSYITSCIIVGFYFERWRALATAIAVSGSAAGVVVLPVILDFVDDYTWREQLQVLSGTFVVNILAALTYRPIAPVRVEASPGPNIQKKLEILERAETNDSDIAEFDYDDEASSVWENTRLNRLNNMRYPTAADIHGGGTAIVSQLEPAEFQMQMTNKSMVSEYNRMPDTDLNNRRKICNLDCFICHRKLHHVDTKIIIITRPLYREDIFFFGPLSRLHKYRKTKTMMDGVPDGNMTNYHMEVTRLAAHQDILDQQSIECICCPHAIVRILATMFDMNLLRHCSFTMFMFSGFFTAAGMFLPFIYVTDMNKSFGLKTHVARSILSVIGFTNILGRVLCGLISIFPKIKAIIVMEVCLIISGLVIILMPFFPNIVAQFTCGCIFGLTIAVNGALRPIVIVDLYGLEKLTNAFGIAVLFQGVACSIGIPVAGVLKDISGCYHSIMIFAGGCLVISGLLILPVTAIATREKNAEFSKKFYMEQPRQSVDPSVDTYAKHRFSWLFKEDQTAGAMRQLK